jgi:predicted permease
VLSTLWQDVRTSLRLLARNPGSTAFAVTTLALALGANTAVFSVMNGVLLRALPYPEPDRLVDMSILMPPAGGQPGRRDFLDNGRLENWPQGTRRLEPLAAYSLRPFTLSGQGNPERLTGASVSAALFPLLRVPPFHGAIFRPEQQQPGADRVVLLSYGLWQRRFQGDPRIVGKAVTLEGTPYTVAGVMPESFYFPRREVQLWTPLVVAAPTPRAASVIQRQYFPVVARLRDGASIAPAEAEAQAIFRRLGEDLAGTGDDLLRGRVRLIPLRDEMVSAARPALWVMSVAVGLVLLITCINFANLLLARNSARQREMAIRSAMGGGRARLVRQMLTESMVLALAAGIVGMLVASWIHLLLPSILPHDIPRVEEIQLDARVFLFTLFLAGLTGMAIGLLPALRGAVASLVAPLHGGTSETSREPASGSLLVVAEVGLAFVLLVGAGLLLRSYLRLAGVELGYEPDRVLTATLALDPARYGAPARADAFVDELLRRLTDHRGVQAAGVVSFPPLTTGLSLVSLRVAGERPARTLAVPQRTSPGYLRALGLRLAAGRWLTDEDVARQAPVAVVNETFARRYIAGPRAIGRRLEVGAASLEIVGVIEDVRLVSLDSAPKPEFFTSYRQAKTIPGGGPEPLTLTIRTAGDPTALLPYLRTLILQLDPDLALEDVRTMNAKLSASVAQPRFYALLLAAFAGIALMLCSAGVYAVLSYSVARQTRAIGVRRALGARRRDILTMVFRRGFTLVTLGLAIGMAVAMAATRVLAHLLFSVTTRDPLSYVVAAVSLAGVAGLACYLPARRAIRVDPSEALRHDG